MAINFNSEPYFDDFDEKKGFHRILFRPGYAVQARELTQLQTQIQDQIEKFGNNIFRQGTVVVGGQSFFQNDLVSIKIGSDLYGNTLDPDIFSGVETVGLTSGTKAIIRAITVVPEYSGFILLAKVISGDEFLPGETIESVIDGTTYVAEIDNTNPFSRASVYSISSGIFYINGKFVYTEDQTVVVDPFTNLPTKNIGFLVNEVVTSAENDESLLDNAQGSPNYTAPGADRYTIELQLSVKNLEDEINNFSELARVIDGELIVNVTKTIYSEIGNELARRTFDESGDYTVKPWPIQIAENTQDNSKFNVTLDPGKGYIKGFEFETNAQFVLPVDKARTFAQASGANVNVFYGNYVFVNNLSGVFNTTTLQLVDLRNSSNTIIGTARVRFLVKVTSTVYRMYLFAINMNSGQIFSNVTSITSTGASAAITSDSRINNITFLTGTGTPELVFPFTNNFVKTVRDSIGSTRSEYQFQRTYSASFSTGIASITLASNLESFAGNNPDNFIVVNTSTNQVIDLTSAVITISGSEGSIQTVTINIGSGTFNASITVLLNANLQTEKVKTLSNYSYRVISSPNTTIGNRDSIGVSDIFDVKSIFNTGNTNPTTQLATTGKFNPSTGDIIWDSVPNTNVTGNYVIDNGQRSEIYDHGSIVLNGTAPSSSNYIVVVYRNFTHIGEGFFTVDSYSNIDYEQIPVFSDQATGKTFNLRDCVDFRPRRADNSTNLVGNKIPNPLGTFEADYQYYLSRMDRVIAMPDKTFIVKSGIPSVNPNLPVNDTNGMVIYDLVVPAYTFNLKDILIRYADNKRYTMRDIGRLERRIGNLEYYTQLSLLEKQARDSKITDSSNFEKFKNGIAVDPFTSTDIFAGNANRWANRRWGWWNAWFNGGNNWNTFSAQNYNQNSIADAGNIDFNAAIDPVNQELRSAFDLNYYEFNVSSLTNTRRSDDLVSLQYSEAPAVQQLIATSFINVNPFDVIKFEGRIRLVPPFDNWIDTNNLPAVNQVVDIQVPDASDIIVNNTIGRGSRVTSISSTSETVSNIVSETTASIGTNVVDVQFVPFIRGKSILCKATSFKPNSRHYTFLDRSPVDIFCVPLTLIRVENHSGNLFDGENFEALTFTGGGSAKAVLYSQPTIQDPSIRLLTVDEVSGNINVGSTVTGANGGTGTVVSVTTYNFGDPIIPDEFGQVAFRFNIPNGVFRTGQRILRVINNEDNDIDLQESIGESFYTATGIIQTKQETLLTTRAIQNQTTVTVTRTVVRRDPVAQTFTISDFTYPEGAHVSSVDVFFRTKSQTVPVTMEIRRSVNGFPESVARIPFASVTVKPEDVNVSTNASLATKFTFPAPIYLSPGEYSIVILANTSDYNVFVAETGKPSLGNGRIVDKQPYTGSLFISQNASTWTPDQNKDLMFQINRAVFNTSGNVEFEIDDVADVFDYQTLFVNSSLIAPPTTKISWFAKAYNPSGLFDSDFSPININQDLNYNLLKRLAPEGSISGNSLVLRAVLETGSDAVSPMVDISGLSVVAALNEINNDSSGETSNIGGTAFSKYITRQIKLADGFDASNLNVTLDINKLPGSDVKVYYRAQAADKTTPISEIQWIEMELETPIPNSSNSFEYREHRFFPPGAFNGLIPVDGPISPSFNTFQIKLVLLSSNRAITPKIRDLRIIALES